MVTCLCSSAHEEKAGGEREQETSRELLSHFSSAFYREKDLEQENV